MSNPKTDVIERAGLQVRESRESRRSLFPWILKRGKPRSVSLPRSISKEKSGEGSAAARAHNDRDEHRNTASGPRPVADLPTPSTGALCAPSPQIPPDENPSLAPPVRSSCWQKALQTLMEKPEMREAINIVKEGLASQSEGVAETIQDAVRNQARRMEERELTLPFKVRVKTVKIRASMNVVLKSILAFKDCTSLIAKLDPHGIAPLIWGGVAAVLQVKLNASEMMATALKSIEKSSLIISRYSKTENLYINTQDATPDEGFESRLIHLYIQIIEYQIALVAFFKRSSFGRLLRAIPGLDNFNQLLEKIEVADKECRGSIQVHDSQMILKMSNSIDDLLARNLWQDKLAILDWISETSPSYRHNYLLENAKMGETYAKAGEWLFKHRSYVEWRDTDQTSGPASAARCLWLHGPVGTGKSAVTARVIESLLENSAEVGDEAIAYFYCFKGESGYVQSDPEIVLCSILRQLAWSVDGQEIATCVQSEYRASSALKIRPSCARCVDLLEGLIEPFQKVTIIVDGLDECSRASELLTCLADLNKRTNGDLRIYLSGRNNVQIPGQFEKFDVDVGNTDTSADLKEFIRHESEKRPFYQVDLFESEDKVKEMEARERINDALSLYGEGMFKWVELQLDLFFEYTTRPEAIYERLERLQQGLRPHQQTWSEKLDSTYDEIWNMNTRGGDADRANAIRVFRICLSFARPITSLEIAELVSLDEGRFQKADPKYILRITRNLIMEDEKSHCIRVCHLSAAEYISLKREGDCDTFALLRCHAFMAELCLKLVQDSKEYQCDAHRGGKDGPPKAFRIDKELQDLISYASVLWLFHCKGAGNWLLESRSLRESFLSFLDPSSKSYGQWWMPALNWSREGDERLFLILMLILRLVPNLPSALFMAVLGGFLSSVKKELLATWETKPYQTVTWGEETILHIASMYGDAFTVQGILEHGAKKILESRNDSDMTALEFAVAHKHANVAKILLDYGASMTTFHHTPPTLIHVASSEADGPMLKVLLEKAEGMASSGDVLPILETRNKDDELPLHILTKRRSTRLVQAARFEAVAVLLDRGADVNAKDRNQETAVHHIACQDPADPGLMALLLRHRAEPNAKARHGRGPLHQICMMSESSERQEVMLLLLKNGANPNLMDDEGKTALHHAVYSQDPRLVQLLLENGADTKAQDIYGETPLHKAASVGAKLILPMLLERGADISIRNRVGKTASDIAHEKDRVTVTSLMSEQRSPSAPDVTTQQNRRRSI